MKSIFFDSQVTYDEFDAPIYDRPSSAADLRSVFASFIANGVFITPSTNLQVTIGSGLQVVAAAGKCWINGAFGYTTSDTNLTLTTADGTNPRIDRVVARLDLNTDVRSIDLYVVDGTAAASPVAPALTQTATVYEIGLADVLVPANATSILQSNITDLRQNEDYCGVVHAAFDQVDTADLFAQFQAAFDEWFADLEDYWDGTDFGALQTAIATHASQHSTGGTDPIAAADIGAAAASHNHAYADLTGVAAASHNHAVTDLSGVAKSAQGIRITVQSTAPTSPAINDLWVWDS
ncbi:MAG TPA: hypothetical protein PLV03_02345 [Clostridiales bacterium]|nr:hypothetical protein [Clostridiales bacterium]